MEFKEIHARVTGAWKRDCLLYTSGTAKGGMTVAIKQELGLPVRFVGVGEGIDDLQPFDADAFARALIGA